MKPALIAFILLALTACAHVSPDTQAKIDAMATTVCMSADFAHALCGVCATTPTAPGHDFCARNLEAEKKVYAGVNVACTPPYTLGPDVLVQKVTRAVKDIQALSGGTTAGPAAP